MIAIAQLWFFILLLIILPIVVIKHIIFYNNVFNDNDIYILVKKQELYKALDLIVEADTVQTKDRLVKELKNQISD